MRRWIIAVALAASTALTVGMPASAASADESDCVGTFYSEQGRELFRPALKYVPPPLRSTPMDCYSRIIDEPFDDGVGIGFSYNALLVDTDWARAVEVLRSFRDAGWIPSSGTIEDAMATVDVGDGVLVALAVDEVIDLPSAATLRYRAADPANDGSNFVEITFVDGDVYQIDAGLPGSQIEVAVFATVPWGATDLDDPSTLSGLPTIFEKAPTPAQWGVIGVGSLMLMLVVGWPSALLNSVVGSRYQALVHWFTTRFRRKPKTGDADPAAPADGAPAPIKRSGLPGWLMWPGFALAAILGAFVDPDFGVNWMSLRLVVTLFLSFLLFNLLAWFIVRRVAVRLQPDSDPYLRFRWGSLILVIVAVLVARLLQLEPGVIFGLVAGVAYATTLKAAKNAVVTIVGSAIGLAFALIAWVGYSLLAPLEVDNFAMIFLVEFLAGVTVKGVSSLPLSLLPLGNLDGAKLFGWRKVVWGASYVVALAAFMLVLLTIPKAWGEIPGDFLRWLILFGVYALVAIVIWAVNARMLKMKPLPPEREQGDQPDAITLD